MSREEGGVSSAHGGSRRDDGCTATTRVRIRDKPEESRRTNWGAQSTIKMFAVAGSPVNQRFSFVCWRGQEKRTTIRDVRGRVEMLTSGQDIPNSSPIVVSFREAVVTAFSARFEMVKGFPNRRIFDSSFAGEGGGHAWRWHCRSIFGGGCFGD